LQHGNFDHKYWSSKLEGKITQSYNKISSLENSYNQDPLQTTEPILVELFRSCIILYQPYRHYL